MRSFHLTVTSLALTLAAQPIWAEPEIRAVTLSTAGMTLIEAEADQSPAGISLIARRGDMNALLQSLRIADPAGAPARLSFPGPGALDDTFAPLPFGPADLGDMARMLQTMVGAPVTATRAGLDYAGRNMGTRDMPCDSDPTATCTAMTLRQADGAIRQIPLDATLSLRFDDAGDRDMIDRAIAATRASAGQSVIDLTLTSDDDTARRITLGWLQPGQPWKTAWRAEDAGDGLVLTGWAVLENTTGQDWNDITLTLATGAVQTLNADLYDRDPKLAAPVMDMALSARAADAEMMFESAPMAVQMSDATSISRYTLEDTVNLQAGAMISLPFLRETLEQGQIRLYRGQSGQPHPMIGFEVENPLPLRLPAGIVTVFERGGGHAGDAHMPELAPGGTAVVEYASDTAIAIREEQSEIRDLARLVITDGVMLAEEQQRQTTRYIIEGAPREDRVVQIDHPSRAGWTLDTTGGTDRFDATRFSVTADAGQIATLELTESRPVRQRIGLTDLSDRDLAYWLDAAPDDASRALLTRLRDLRARQADARAEAARLQSVEAELIAEQARLVDLITRLGGESGATAARRARVDAIDAELVETTAARRAAETRAQDAAEAIRDLIAG